MDEGQFSVAIRAHLPRFNGKLFKQPDVLPVDRNQIVIDKPIKTLGVHGAKVQLHPEVLVAVQINVARSQEEADRQARGENVTVIKDEKLDIETYSEDMFEEGAVPKDEDEAEEA